jgi:hypothetical protein
MEAAMATIASLWLPILLAAVFVFFASFVIHMVLPWHRGDFKKLPDEDQVLAALRPFKLPAGNYIAPYAGSPAAMKDPAWQEKRRLGPVAFVTVMDGTGGMGPQLLQWFLFCCVVSVFAAYVAGRALPVGANYLDVFRFAGTTAFAGYSLALAQSAIWYKKSWGATIKQMIDGLLYACLTAGTLGWLWPR